MFPCGDRMFTNSTGRGSLRRFLYRRRSEAEFEGIQRICRTVSQVGRKSVSTYDGRIDFHALSDATATTGFDTHYIYHCAWAARVIAALKPAVHTDISSSLYFCTQISAFVPVRFYDYRPASVRLSNLACGQADLTKLPFADASVDCISCMHVVEHLGLGRYGDPIGPDDDLKGMRELERVLAVGGTLLFVVPVGMPSIRFNAHRIYSYEQIAASFGRLKLQQFALIPNDAASRGIILDADPKLVKDQEYGCGCFTFRRDS